MIIPLATTRALDGPRSSSTESFMPQSVAIRFVLASESHVLTLPLAPAPIFGVKIHLFAANFSLDESRALALDWVPLRVGAKANEATDFVSNPTRDQPSEGTLARFFAGERDIYRLMEAVLAREGSQGHGAPLAERDGRGGASSPPEARLDPTVRSPGTLEKEGTDLSGARKGKVSALPVSPGATRTCPRRSLNSTPRPGDVRRSPACFPGLTRLSRLFRSTRVVSWPQGRGECQQPCSR